MSETKERIFTERVSPFLKQKMADLLARYGAADERYRALSLQYLKSPLEEAAAPESNLRHYEAEVVHQESALPKGIERLYRRTLVIEITISCVANCRYCLRQKYDLHTFTEDEILRVAKYCGSQGVREDLNEVLITGGDAFLVPQKLNLLVEALMRYAPNVTTMRVATRIPQQSPERVTDAILDVFRNKPGIRFEVATQTNHAVEFFQEVRECFKRLKEVVPTIYSQNVLLKGVNDTPEALLELYDTMRILGIEAHYLFHAIPLQGMHHFRTTVDKGLSLTKMITSSGIFSGRAKPMYAAMTDIGKIIFYEGTIKERDTKNNRLLLQSCYMLKNRREWNPSWQLPGSAQTDKQGYLQVWYLDGSQ
ncbi:MAG: radical SAM protein [Patescibacteria group bacterium]|jgi:lysine 2,3-aminomutase